MHPITALHPSDPIDHPAAAGAAAPTLRSMSASPAIELDRPVDAIADAFVDECVQRYPETATYLGIHGHDDAWSDYSPDGFADQAAHLRRTIAALHSAAPSDDRENTAKEAMLERLGLEVELYEAHITTSRVSVIGGQAQEIRAIFDLMPTEGEDAWRNIAARLRTVETATAASAPDPGRRGPRRQHLRRPADPGHDRADPLLDGPDRRRRLLLRPGGRRPTTSGQPVRRPRVRGRPGSRGLLRLRRLVGWDPRPARPEPGRGR